MKDLEKILVQLCSDGPIEKEALKVMEQRIMIEIMTRPSDFAYEQELVKRQRWGLIMLGSYVIFLTSLAVLLWFNFEVLTALFAYILTMIWPAVGKIKLLIDFQSSIIFFGQRYSWQLIGILLITLLSLIDRRNRTRSAPCSKQ